MKNIFPGSYHIAVQERWMRRHCSRRKPRHDAVGELLMLFGVNSGWFSIFAAFAGVAMGIDPYNYVFEEFIPHPTYRGIGFITGVWMARFGLSILCVCEFIRFIIFLIFIITLLTLMCASSLTKMLTIRGNACVILYAQLRILFAWGFAILSDPVGFAILCTHFATIFSFGLPSTVGNLFRFPL